MKVPKNLKYLVFRKSVSKPTQCFDFAPTLKRKYKSNVQETLENLSLRLIREFPTFKLLPALDSMRAVQKLTQNFGLFVLQFVY